LRTTIVFFQQSGGAIGRVPSNATAFPTRGARANMLTAVGWRFGSESAAHVQWLREYWGKLERWSGGYYVNDADPDHTAAALSANYGANYPRLVALKNQYDPTNLFRLNANVKPGATG
jgi:hypothetical protein